MSRDDLTPQFIVQMAHFLVGLSVGHSALESRFLRAGAPGPPPAGSMADKATAWLERLGADDTVDSLQIIGKMSCSMMLR